MTKQTATEWLIEQVKSKEWQDMFIWHKEEVFNQAKAMEKEQMIDACNQTEFEDEEMFGTSEVISKGELYYYETYKGGDK